MHQAASRQEEDVIYECEIWQSEMADGEARLDLVVTRTPYGISISPRLFWKIRGLLIRQTGNTCLASN